MESKITAKQVMRKLNISRSYLYKLKEEHNIDLVQEANGRYQWTEKAVQQLQLALDISEQDESERKIASYLEKYQVKRAHINNRRYLGNKFTLSDFIRDVVDKNCVNVNIVADLFCGTGSVANAFKDKMLVTNDLLFFNYLINYAWFAHEDYSEEKIIQKIAEYNFVDTSENNYMRQNFADTFFNADNCSKIGFIREDIENLYNQKKINYKEYSILITSLIYAMDKIANTVGHYDAYRKNSDTNKNLVLSAILPDKDLNKNNRILNQDINALINNIECDLLYLDPPYNSRQYGDAYHLLENIARWEKPEVFGVAKKMDRTHLKSDYCTNQATKAFEDLIEKSRCKYILLSYNNMSNKGNDRSNAKIADKDIIRILEKKGKVKVFEKDYKAFSSGKSNISDNSERLFFCEVYQKDDERKFIASPLNYTGGKFKILEQIFPHIYERECFLDLFSGGANVGVNSISSKVILNDNNKHIINLLEYFYHMDINFILDKVDKLISDYNLSNTSKFGYDYYGCNSSEGLANVNKKGYLALRHFYNSSKNKDPLVLYVLIIYSFNNQIRFNKKEEFNLPVGKRDFNNKMRNKLIDFCGYLKKKDIEFINNDFRNVSLKKLNKNTFIYCDPPYLITTASYNENGGWDEEDEKALLDYLSEANDLGFYFALSNVFTSKGNENHILKKWVVDNNFNVIYLDKNYANSNYQRKNKELETEEVLITNY
ncbi:Dam family site-specific DNA-(adenine-N6)-methyltransferase [Mannheimia haemolytica]|nr:Dam family site-specific DNA-(adenine-N6)-methyltransferase [Mannheimia haemolytica]STY62657.1 Modification methylase FokI [Mannheimia haemolytica]